MASGAPIFGTNTTARGAGGDGGGGEGANLDQFFDDVESVKEDMRGLQGLHRWLQSVHEERRTVHNARAIKSLRGRMDADVEQVLHHAKAASRQLPNCGPGSSTDHTRSSVVSGLSNKLKDLMDDF
ncbi:hypothetical protein ABZP36_020495 [Zizania latifolia]